MYYSFKTEQKSPQTNQVAKTKTKCQTSSHFVAKNVKDSSNYWSHISQHSFLMKTLVKTIFDCREAFSNLIPYQEKKHVDLQIKLLPIIFIKLKCKADLRRKKKTEIPIVVSSICSKGFVIKSDMLDEKIGRSFKRPDWNFLICSLIQGSLHQMTLIDQFD